MEKIESWRRVWRVATKHLSTPSLLALREALEKDSKELIQRATTTPPPLQCVQDWPVEAACLIGFCGWKNGEGLNTVAEVEDFFARVCFNLDQELGEPAGCRCLLNWWDETSREEAFHQLLPEVDLALSLREG